MREKLIFLRLGPKHCQILLLSALENVFNETTSISN